MHKVNIWLWWYIKTWFAYPKVMEYIRKIGYDGEIPTIEHWCWKIATLQTIELLQLKPREYDIEEVKTDWKNIYRLQPISNAVVTIK